MTRTQFPPNSPELLRDLLNCTILSGPPGCGKSTAMIFEIATVPGRYVLAAPRIDLLEEHAARLRDLAKGTALVVLVIHSRQSERAVDRRLQKALDESADAHIVVLTTHEGLMGLTSTDTEDWHVRIDELPETAIISDVVGLGASWPALRDRYDLVPASEAGWSRMVRRADVEPLGLRQCLADVGATGLTKLHRLANSRGRSVEVNIGAWADAGVSGKVVQWRSIWTIASLRGCTSVKVAAAGYAGSIIGHATARAGGVHVEVVDLTARRTGQPRIRLHWYTRCPGSTTYWATHEGSACVAAIGKHLQRIGFRGYWMANKAAAPYLRHQFAGVEISPRSAGTNTLRGHVSCAAVYSSKATRADEAVMTALDLDRRAIQIAREDEDLAQAVTRGAIRDIDFSGVYDVHVYDEVQATSLRDRLLAGGYDDVTLVPVPEAGIMDVVRPVTPRGKQATEDAIETAAEREERLRLAELERGRRRRAKAKKAKEEAGTYKSRGRPKGSGSRSAAPSPTATLPSP